MKWNILNIQLKKYISVYFEHKCFPNSCVIAKASNNPSKLFEIKSVNSFLSIYLVEKIHSSQKKICSIFITLLVAAPFFCEILE